MKIAIIAAGLPEKNKKTGGVSVAVNRLANELAKTPGNTVTVFSLSEQPENSDYQYRALFPNLRRFRENKLFVIYILPILLNFVDFSDFDVAHFHGDDWFYFARKIPSVRTIHGSALYEARTATSLKRKLLQYSVFPLEKLSAHLASLTIGVGKDSQRIYNTDKLIGNGVDVSLFAPSLKTEFPSLFFIGTWEGRKRGSFLHQIFINKILPRIPNAKLYVVSDYWPEHPNVIQIKYPNDTDLAKALSKAWVFTYPSTYEGFGIPYIEALSSGTSIVTTNNIGAHFVLSHGDYGIISNDQDFPDGILHLLNSSSMRKKFETKGVERASEFSWQEISIQHLDAYQEAIQIFAPDLLKPVEQKRKVVVNLKG